MKTTISLLISLPLLMGSFLSHAHDPKMHMKKAEKANCVPFEKMKNSGAAMDMNDPVMLAMKSNCEKQMKPKMKAHNDMTSGDVEHDKMKHDEVKKTKGIKKNKTGEHSY